MRRGDIVLVALPSGVTYATLAGDVGPTQRHALVSITGFEVRLPASRVTKVHRAG